MRSSSFSVKTRFASIMILSQYSNIMNCPIVLFKVSHKRVSFHHLSECSFFCCCCWMNECIDSQDDISLFIPQSIKGKKSSAQFLLPHFTQNWFCVIMKRSKILQTLNLIMSFEVSVIAQKALLWVCASWQLYLAFWNSVVRDYRVRKCELELKTRKSFVSPSCVNFTPISSSLWMSVHKSCFMGLCNQTFSYLSLYCNQKSH